ncbi:MAG: glycoside hydrolase family 32 protein [Bryobacteraceae bacterium]|nr:glycoside hydrolase family 32 protein [Bryobacteraceae bacterium]
MDRRSFAKIAAAAAAAAPVTAAPTIHPDYDQRLRPQFHFSPKKGWTNDPNGLVLYKGEYHLFFQHNPFDVKWGNMTWGHAISKDLVHWKQMEQHALSPDNTGTMFSGSAVVDWDNTAGLQKGDEKTIVLLYTAAGGTSPESKGQPYTQCMAYSTDRGRTFTKYAGNPVLPNVVKENRDPKVVWHAPTRRWIMTLFLDGTTFAFFSSPDLKKWTLLQEISVPKTGECPDFFEMPVENEPGVTRWIWTGANGNYLVGTFDGKRFMPEVMTQSVHSGTNYYAVQTYSDLPGNRRVQMAWMNFGQYPGMPFNQQMSCPYEFRLRKYAYHSYRIFATPVAEIDALRETPKSWKDVVVKPGENPLSGVKGDCLDIVAEIEPGTAKELGFRVRGRTVNYLVRPRERDNLLASEKLSTNLGLRDKKLSLRILVDRASVEVFGNDGEAVIPACFLPKDDNLDIEFYTVGGEAKIVSLNIYPMRSIWS